VKVICSNRDADGSLLNVTTDNWTEIAGIKAFYAGNGFASYRRQVKKKDVLFINGIYSIHFNILPLIFLPGRKIISARGMLNRGALSQKRFKKHIYLFLWKLTRLHLRYEFHATSLKEKEEIQQVFGHATKVWVIPNLPRANKVSATVEKAKGHLILCTAALISPMKNHHLVLQALKKSSRTIEYFICGPVKDTRYWAECQRMIKDLPGNITVCYLGEVQPERVSELISRCHVYIQPSLSENFGHSLCEALTIGRPVITSHMTPWNHLREKRAGCNVSIDNADELHEIINVFADMEYPELTEWSKCAGKYIDEALDVNVIKGEYLKMFDVIISN
jgi:glycosyltransferase involved in cell wall biosynthesis